MICDYIHSYVGELVSEPINVGAAVRDYTCMKFNKDFSLLYCGTSSGDVTVISMKHLGMYTSFKACHGGVGFLSCMDTNIVVGGGDQTFSVWNMETSSK